MWQNNNISQIDTVCLCEVNINQEQDLDISQSRSDKDFLFERSGNIHQEAPLKQLVSTRKPEPFCINCIYAETVKG